MPLASTILNVLPTHIQALTALSTSGAVQSTPLSTGPAQTIASQPPVTAYSGLRDVPTGTASTRRVEAAIRHSPASTASNTPTIRASTGRRNANLNVRSSNARTVGGTVETAFVSAIPATVTPQVVRFLVGLFPRIVSSVFLSFLLYISTMLILGCKIGNSPFQPDDDNDFVLSFNLDRVGALQKKLSEFNLLIEIDVPKGGSDTNSIWNDFDIVINAHCLVNEITLPHNRAQSSDSLDPSNLSWQLLRPHKSGFVHNYLPHGKLTRNTFNLETLSKGPFGKTIPNHHAKSAPGTFFVMICMLRVLTACFLIVISYYVILNPGPRYGPVTARSFYPLNRLGANALHACLDLQILLSIQGSEDTAECRDLCSSSGSWSDDTESPTSNQSQASDVNHVTHCHSLLIDGSRSIN